MEHRFCQVDVFARDRFEGNPLAVVIVEEQPNPATGQVGPSTEQMQQFANWTNLSETTFLLPATEPGADYLVRIFTPMGELPFAGHPTLGTCHVWLDNVDQSDRPQTDGPRVVVQQCEAGLVEIEVRGSSGTRELVFKAPPMIRSGPVEPDVLAEIVSQLDITAGAVIDAAWIDNGPGWVGLLLDGPSSVLSVSPKTVTYDIGLLGLTTPDDPGPVPGAGLVLRSFFPKDGATVEDPVTGSLNASAAQWLLTTGRISAPYTASQGTELGRDGLVLISQDSDGAVWVGGHVVDCVQGTVQI